MIQAKDHIDTFGASLLISFSLLLGLNQVCIKLVNAGLDPGFQAGLRSLCAFFPVLLFAMVKRRELSVSNGSLLPGIAVGVLFAGEFLLLFKALDHSSVARVSVLFYTMPFWLAIAAHVFIPGEQLNRLKVIGLLLAISGVLLTLSNSVGTNSETRWLGDLYCLLAAGGWAAIVMVTRTTALKKSCPEMQLLYQLAVSAPILLAVAWANGEFIREPTLFTWGIFAFQVLVVVSVGFLSWFWVLSIYPVSKMAVFSFLAPVFGVLFGWLLLDEVVGLNILLALILIAVGIALVNWPSSSGGSSSKQP